MALERFLDILIDANAIVLIAALAFLIIESVNAFAGYRRSYATRLWLLTGALTCGVLLPLMPFLLSYVDLRAAPHISDILIAQYLKGHISVSAVSFDQFLSARSNALQAVHVGSNPWMIAGVTALMIAIVGRMAYIATNMIRIRRLITLGFVLRRTARVKVIVSSCIHVPFSTRGLRYFYVVVPASLVMDTKTLAIAIGHEFQHIRQRDVTVEFCLALLSPLFIINPGFWVLSQRTRKLRELSCDIAYLKRSIHSVGDYATALLTVAKQANLSRRADKRANQIGSLSVPFIGRSRVFPKTTSSMLAQRVLAFTADDLPRPNRLFLAGMMLSVSVMMIVASSAVIHAQSGWTHDRLMFSSVANLERLNTRTGQNGQTTFGAPSFD